MLRWPIIFTRCIFSKGARAVNYIANNLQNSHFALCFCVLRNTPVNLIIIRMPFKTILGPEMLVICNINTGTNLLLKSIIN